MLLSREYLRRAILLVLNLTYTPTLTWAMEEDTLLEPVIVSATRFSQNAVPTPNSITVISREDIEASGASGVHEVLRGQGGVQLTDLYGDGSRTRASMRGFGENASSNTLVLIDGRRLNNPDIAAPELNSIALKDVERIEIIQGSAGTLFGDQAVGGVINIIMRTPDRLRAKVNGSVASYDGRTYIASVSHKIDERISFRLSGEDRTSDNYREHNKIEYDNFLGRIDFRHRNSALFFDAQSVQENAELPGGLFRPQFDINRRQPRFRNDFANTDSEAQRIGLRQILTPDWQLEMELTRRDSDITGVLSDTNFTQRRRIDELTPRLLGTYRNAFGDMLFTLGLDKVHSQYEIKSKFGLTENKQRTQGLYAQAVVPVSPRIHLTLGARRSRVENDLRDSFSFTNGVELDDRVSVNEIGLAMQLRPGWRWFVRRDGNFRFAKVDEHTATLGGVVGLDTQTGRSLEAGTEWRGRENRIKLVLYRLDLDNEIDFDTTSFANVNLDPTRRDGYIVEYKYRAAETLDLAAQYSHVDANFISGSFQGRTVPFVAANTVRISANYRFAKPWNIFGEMQYTDDRVAAGDLSNTLERLDGYRVINIGANYRRKRWRTTLRLNNLTDKKYSDYAASSFNPATSSNETAFYASPERNFRLTVQYHFERQS